MATVGPIQGSVLVNRGTGFVQLSPDAALSPGDRLMARVGSSATLKYADGCPVKVKAGSTVTVGAKSPCQDFVAQADRPVAEAVAAPSAGIGGIPVVPAVVGTVLVAGGVAAAVVLSSNNSTPVAPAATVPLSP